MSTTNAPEVPNPIPAQSPSPYTPSWIDRLMRWLDGLPLPVPVVLIGTWLVLVAIVHLAIWHEGILARWQLDRRVLLINTWIPYSLGLIYYLERTAGEALKTFRPALDMADEPYAALRYEFTVLPMRGVLISNFLGALLAYISLRMFPATSRPFMDTPLAAAVNMTLSIAAAAVVFAALYLTYRQLRLIRRAYAQAKRLDLFRSGELYAFSALTLRMGIGWLIFMYAGALFYPALVRNIPWATTAVLVLGGIAVSLVTTLLDIHKSIASVKASYLAEIDVRLQAAFAELHRRIDGDEVGGLGPLREVMDALLVERQVVAKIPTWPWQSGTLAGFLAAVVLPLIVWAVQMVLQRFFGL